ncbi:ABC transporter permease subunit [Nesterenkonia salmonea]|uniref:ABC transporter permease subunit n=1 Tax=Nesterenkonia salmonea TaxID=1804987 RepID=A0A5R9BM79_9MICC|nr:ABC transporter permease subunit [Nesterenkonia salmonea]TLQ01051.1 ABC transporter permease subunit [Nesterenkonia salmonea]
MAAVKAGESTTAASEKATHGAAPKSPGRQNPVLRVVKASDPLALAGMIIILAAWYVVTEQGWVRPVFLPAPEQVFRFAEAHFLESRLVQTQNLGDGGILENLIYTTTSVWLAVLLAIIVAVPIGLASARVQFLRMFSDPSLLTLGAVPVLILMPFFLVWFGVSRNGQLLLLVLVAVPIIYVYAQRAVTNLDPVYAQSALVLGVGRVRLIKDVYLRGTLPEILGGVRIALAGSWSIAAIAELMGAPQGMGRLISTFAANTNITGIFATILILAIVATLTDITLKAVFMFANRWGSVNK